MAENFEDVENIKSNNNFIEIACKEVFPCRNHLVVALETPLECSAVISKTHEYNDKIISVKTEARLIQKTEIFTKSVDSSPKLVPGKDIKDTTDRTFSKTVNLMRNDADSYSDDNKTVTDHKQIVNTEPMSDPILRKQQSRSTVIKKKLKLANDEVNKHRPMYLGPSRFGP